MNNELKAKTKLTIISTAKLLGIFLAGTLSMLAATILFLFLMMSETFVKFGLRAIAIFCAIEIVYLITKKVKQIKTGG